MSEYTVAPNFEQWARLKGVALVKDEEARAEQESQEKCTWEEVSNKPSEFTPSAHTHKLADVTDYKEPDLSKFVTITKLSSVKQELQSEIKTEVANLVDGAPEALNTLKELGDAFGENKNGVTEVLNQIGEVKASLSDYALKSEIPTLPENHVSKEEFDAAVATIPSIEGLASEVFVTEKIAEVEGKIPTIPSHDELATKTEVEEAVKNVVKYEEFTYNGQTRKTVQLANYDSISGVATTGEGHNLVMLSKWDVADFGAVGVHLNLNTKDTVTINDKEEVATVSYVDSKISEIEIPSIEGLATESFVEEKIATVDHSAYALKSELSEVASGIISAIPSVDGLASVEYVDTKVANVAIPDVSNFATRNEVATAKTEAIVAASGDAAAKYATLESLEEVKASIPVLPEDHVTKSELEEVVAEVESKIPSIPTDHVTIEELAAAIFRINILEGKVSDLSKTNVSSIVAGEATSVKDETADLVIATSTDSAPITSPTTYTGKSVDVKSMSVDSSRLTFNAVDGDVAITGYTSTGSIDGKVVEIIANSGEHIKITNSVLGQGGYNAINIGSGSTTVDTAPKSILIDNVRLEGVMSNNAINIYGQKENAVITISNCYFKGVSNPVRLFNKTNTSCTVNFINCVCDAWEADENEIVYSGFLILEDAYSGTKEAEIANNVFGDGKITVNFINCTGPHGKIVASDPASFCGVANENQLVYVFRHKLYKEEIAADPNNLAAGIVPYGDGSNYPVINIK